MQKSFEVYRVSQSNCQKLKLVHGIIYSISYKQINCDTRPPGLTFSKIRLSDKVDKFGQSGHYGHNYPLCIGS